MFNKKECVAMLLAGGQGSRLYALTQSVAKPAVPFGAKYHRFSSLELYQFRYRYSGCSDPVSATGT